jgi:hypothetical protein
MDSKPNLKECRAAIMRWIAEMLKTYASLSVEDRAALDEWEQWRDPAKEGSSEWPGFVAKIGHCPWGGRKNGRRPGR